MPTEDIPMAYLAGQIVGRLLASYALVWLGSFALARGDWRQAFARTRRPWGLAAVLLVFLMGLAGLLLKVAMSGDPLGT